MVEDLTCSYLGGAGGSEPEATVATLAVRYLNLRFHDGLAKDSLASLPPQPLTLLSFNDIFFQINQVFRSFHRQPFTIISLQLLVYFLSIATNLAVLFQLRGQSQRTTLQVL